MDETCRYCGAEGFRLRGGACDGCYESFNATFGRLGAAFREIGRQLRATWPLVWLDRFTWWLCVRLGQEDKEADMLTDDVSRDG